ncbi:GTP-binding protein ypt5 [Tritrichomonas foetus]|uniref:GTP-binding protein ypt5 n=1 Tax=Tritrichomonas foetus TaxID=1144522 RepID=A0A1J4K868_9EUKA|nr:GTP-binding protein ypt5 [Tritrichomonas foetus]|eukprot:OHT07403.1 GTP-binding protein ypt5 [Tritrichomonas foetus]
MTTRAKIVFIGNTEVGKTSLIQQYIDKNVDDIQSTVSAAYSQVEIECDSAVVTLDVWDTAGQEKFRSMGTMYYHNADIAVAVFDVTSPQSFDDLEKWIQSFKEHSKSDYVVIVGNKIDLPNELHKVTQEDAENWAAEQNCECFFTSATTGENVNELFENIGKKVAEGNYIVHSYEREEAQKLDDEKSGNESLPCC